MHWSAWSAVEQAVAAMKISLMGDLQWRCHDIGHWDAVYRKNTWLRRDLNVALVQHNIDLR
jgi:hypothetical protein